MPGEGFAGLAGPRGVLRRFHPGGAAGLVAYRSSVPAARFEGWDAPFPPEEGERSARELATGHSGTPGAWFQFAVALPAPRRGCAVCRGRRLSPVRDRGHDRPGVSGARARDRGGAPAAGLLAARGRHRVTACCDPRDAAPVALERLGMRREGHRRRAPGLRADGPTTWCMPCYTMSGSPDENEFTCPHPPQTGRWAAAFPWNAVMRQAVRRPGGNAGRGSRRRG